MKIKTNYLAGIYKIVTEKCDYCCKFESKKEFNIRLTKEQAKVLLKDHFYSKLEIESIELVGENP